MLKLVVLSALVAVAVARPGYFHGLEHAVPAFAVPTSGSHQSRVDVHSRPVVETTYNVPALQTYVGHNINGEGAHFVHENDAHFVHENDAHNIDSISVDVANLHEARNIHAIQDNEHNHLSPIVHTISEHDVHHLATPVINAVHAADAHGIENIHHLAEPVIKSVPSFDAHNIHNVQHLTNSGIHAIDAYNVHHFAGPVTHAADDHELLNIKHLETPVVHAVDAHNVHHLVSPIYKSVDDHNVHHLAVDAHEINHPENHFVQHVAIPVINAVHVSPVVQTTDEKTVISSHEIHQVHGTPAIHAVPLVHAVHPGFNGVHHDIPAVHAVAVPASSVSHSARTDIHKTSSSVVGHVGSAIPAIQSW